ncbi:MAG TPA: hypothetical protein VIU12_10605 [Chryseolinea sp.]
MPRTIHLKKLSGRKGCLAGTKSAVPRSFAGDFPLQKRAGYETSFEDIRLSNFSVKHHSIIFKS